MFIYIDSCFFLYRFLGSESDLNEVLTWFIGLGSADIDILQSLALCEDEQSPLNGFYINFIPLIAHPNTDIGNVIISVLHEIFHDEDNFTDQETIFIISKLAQKCLKADLFGYFIDHYKILTASSNSASTSTTTEDDQDDYQAVFQMFQVIEDTLEIFHFKINQNEIELENENLNLFYKNVLESNLIIFLIKSFQQDPKRVKSVSLSSLVPSGEYTNTLYAAELCATIFQLSASDLHTQNSVLLLETIKKLWSQAEEEVIEPLLVSISIYRQRDPLDSDEQEYLFNLFDILGALMLNYRPAREAFISDRCEGFNLFLMFLKEVNVARIRAIQIVDYVLSPVEDGAQDLMALNFISSGGLKVISPLLMGKGTGKLVKNYPKLLLSVDQDESHVSTILSSLFKNLPVESSAYFRLIAKFAENSGEKFKRLVELHLKYQERVDLFDLQHGITFNSDIMEIEEDWLLDRINVGMFVLQQIDICLLILYNSSKSILEIMKNNPTLVSEIDEELFNAVKIESETRFIVSDQVLMQIKGSVKYFLSQLVPTNTIFIVPLLKSFCEI